MGMDVMTTRQASRFAVQPGWRLILRDAGISAADALSYAGLPADLFTRKDASLTPAEYFRLWHGLGAAAGERNVALTLVRAISVEAFDPPIFASLCSPHLNVALSRLAEYKRLIGPLTCDVLIGPEFTQVTLACYGQDDPLPPSLGVFEALFLVQLARLATRFDVKPTICQLVTLPPEATQCEAFLGCPIELGQSNIIRFSAEDATRPFLTENVAMWEVFEPDLRVRLSKLDVGATMGERVRAALLDMLPSGQSSIDQVAKRLAVSRRSLQRQLEKERIPFRDVLNGVRSELASHYLLHSDLAPGQISYLLGFGDANSFLRAFKGWTGITPGEFRLERSDRPLAHALR
ncbi:AraC family transcriptional regulator [Dyella sp. C9]|uniref:AraC family transcriptional regulator n=1 Tax=Dyella sp. C9 TaxID=2202154 RepID=UPI0018E588D6|nr:AraC family transcriptional regulator [Dyella sp. C9]